jgi:hypothetical protein
MNPFRTLVALFLFALLASPRASAQDQTPAATPDTPSYYDHRIDKMLHYLTPEQRAHFKTALYPALEKDPTLKSEGMEIVQQQHNSASEPPADREAHRKQLGEYEARLRQAMTSEDPSVSTIFDQIEAHMHSHR